jgi:ABC-type lipoprotein export system ATPase subunit
MEVFEKLVREQGLTIIMVTHERSFAARASRQIALRDGHVVDDVDQRALSLALPVDLPSNRPGRVNA